MPVEIREISKSFDEKVVLDRVSHLFKPRSVTALTGPSGSGKTTLANILLELIKPDAGQVLGVKALHVGAVFQEDRLIEHMTAHENVALVLREKGDADQISLLLLDVGLDPSDAKRVREYSGGMRRRVAIARALIIRPEFLILDEPFKGLDQETRAQVISAILSRTRETTTLLITHDPEEIEAMGTADSLTLSGENHGA